MTKIKKFEDLTIWRDAKRLVCRIYPLLQENKDYGYKDQIQRAAISIMNNIAEGFDRQTKKEFIQYLYISKVSCSEVRSMLHVAKEINYLDHTTSETLIQESTKLSISINKLIQYLKTDLKHPH